MHTLTAPRTGRSARSGRSAAAERGLTLPLDRDVRHGDRQYPLHLRSGQGAWAELAVRLAVLNADRVFIITTTGVPAATVRATLAAAGRASPVTPLTVPAAEQATATTVVQLAEQVIAAGATRASVIIGLGGGLAGNVAGTVAGWVYRGAPRLVQIPTTLQALCGPALSPRPAVASPWGRGHLGCVKPPDFVWGHLDLLDRLDAGDRRAALCQAAGNVLAVCPERYGELTERLRPDDAYPDAELAWFIDLCLAARQAALAGAAPAEDPGEPLILEYGHTAADAAEHLTAGRLGPGPALAAGLLIAARVSARLGYLGPADERAHHRLLERIRPAGRPAGAPRFPPGLAAEELLAAMRRDHKRGGLPPQPDRVDMVLLDALGRPHTERGRVLTQVPAGVVLDAVRTCTTEGEQT